MCLLPRVVLFVLRSKLILGSLILLSLALSVLSLVSITPVYSQEPVLWVHADQPSVYIRSEGNTGRRHLAIFQSLDPNDTTPVLLVAVSLGNPTQGNANWVTGARVTVVVDGVGRCTGFTNGPPEQGSANIFSCEVPVSGGHHHWYLTASVSDDGVLITGQSQTYSFSVVDTG